MEQPYTTFGSQEEGEGKLNPDERTRAAIRVLKQAIKRLEEAGPGYTKDVISLHKSDDWMVQLAIKVTRARYAANLSKREDELIDVINYAALTLSLVKEDES